MPKRPSDLPTIIPTMEDIIWAAGFLEGEGSFGGGRNTERVVATQANPEPIERLKALFGGAIQLRPSRSPKWQNQVAWVVYGEKARTVMKAVYPLMSSKRRKQIEKAWRNLASLTA